MAVRYLKQLKLQSEKRAGLLLERYRVKGNFKSHCGRTRSFRIAHPARNRPRATRCRQVVRKQSRAANQ
jgi:hypothetical protein